MTILIAVVTVMIGYLVLGQFVVRAALKHTRTGAASPREAELPRRLLHIHTAFGIALLVTVSQLVIAPGESGRHTALKFLPLLAFFLAAAMLPEAQYRRATRTAGMTYADIAVAFVRDGGLRFLQAIIVVATATVVVAAMPSLPWLAGRAAFLLAVAGSVLGILVLFVVNPYLVRLIHRGRRLAEPDLMGRLEAVARKSGGSLPPIYILEDRLQYASAMITGILPGHRFVFISDALLRQASSQEVAAVVAHELAHLRNRDLSRAFARTLIGFLVFFVAATALRRLAISAGIPDGPFRVILTAALPGWVIAMIFQMPASRRREAAADRAAASWVGEEPLATALVRLYEINAMNGHAGKMAKLLSSHPSLADRLGALGRGPAGG